MKISYRYLYCVLLIVLGKNCLLLLLYLLVSESLEFSDCLFKNEGVNVMSF